MTNLNASTTLATTPVPALPPKPKRRKRKIIVIGPNGGGVRKTKTALVFGSVAAAAGCTVIYVCGDRGIGSLSASLKEGGPNRVELLPDEESGNYAETLLAIAEEADADVIIIDLGANEMLNSKSRRTVRAALRQLKVLGHDTFVVLSLVPGKVGLEDDAANFARQMSKDAEVLLAFHSRDEGSDLTKFGELKGDYPTVDVATDQLAILELITAAGVTPFDWCSAHPAGFATAAAWIARKRTVYRAPGQGSGPPAFVDVGHKVFVYSSTNRAAVRASLLLIAARYPDNKVAVTGDRKFQNLVLDLAEEEGINLDGALGLRQATERAARARMQTVVRPSPATAIGADAALRNAAVQAASAARAKAQRVSAMVRRLFHSADWAVADHWTAQEVTQTIITDPRTMVRSTTELPGSPGNRDADVARQAAGQAAHRAAVVAAVARSR